MRKPKTEVTFRRARGSIVTLSLTVAFDEKAPFALEIYRHIAEIIRTGMGPLERKEFLRKLAQAKAAAFPELSGKGGKS